MLPVLLENEEIGGMYFQHDGASPHFRVIVRNFLDKNFRNMCIGRGGPNNWLCRSPDFNPVDYHIWGYLKAKVYSTEINSLEDLIQGIDDACEEIRANPLMIRRATQNILKRAHKCIEQNGGHFEQLL